ncbi:MAG TPA: hypothetical protein VLM79_14220 [Kofleriaceae bacterium]|nr:hypothetical protein [Kofleriaceae bacterium]
MRTPLVITLVVIACARIAAAAPCEGEASDLRSDLQREARRTRIWSWSWRIVHTTSAVVQLGIAASGKANRDDTQALWVGGVKSTLGALNAWFAPPHFEVPVATGDACTDRSMLRGARERNGSDERERFWAAHISGLIVHGIGVLVLAERVSWKAGLQSFALGYPVTLLNVYTMPRESLRRMRARAWMASVTADGERYGVVVAGAF